MLHVLSLHFLSCLLTFVKKKLVNVSRSLRRLAHWPLVKRLMYKPRISGITSACMKSPFDWLDFTGFSGDVRVAFFNGLSGKNTEPSYLRGCRVYNGSNNLSRSTIRLIPKSRPMRGSWCKLVLIVVAVKFALTFTLVYIKITFWDLHFFL